MINICSLFSFIFHSILLAEKHHSCGVCGKLFSQRTTMLKHEATHSKMYQCDKCPKAFSELQRLEKHLKIHERDHLKKYSCPECHLMYETTKQLSKHKYKVHTSKKPKVEMPPLSPEAEMRLKPWACELCPKRYRRYTSRWNHMKRAHNPNPDPGKQYMCLICNKRYKCKERLENHITVKHKNTEEHSDQPSFTTLDHVDKPVNLVQQEHHENIPHNPFSMSSWSSLGFSDPTAAALNMTQFPGNQFNRFFPC